jgi:hypothetical protein
MRSGLELWTGDLQFRFCIPTCNRARSLPETLKTILAKAGPNNGIVISQNSPPDDTEALVADPMKNHPCIRNLLNDIDLGTTATYLCAQLAIAALVDFGEGASDGACTNTGGFFSVEAHGRGGSGTPVCECRRTQCN